MSGEVSRRRPYATLLSDWEVEEAYHSYQRSTVTMKALAARYGVSARTLTRAFRRLEEFRTRMQEPGVEADG